MAETTIVQAIEIMERMKVIDEGDGLETGDHDAVLEALRASRPSSEPRCEAQVHEASSFDTGDHGECPLPSRPSSEPGERAPALVDAFEAAVDAFWQPEHDGSDRDVAAARDALYAALAAPASSPGAGEEEGLRRVASETLRWFEEVDGGPYDWSDDEGAQSIMRDLRTALSGRADATKGGK